MNLAAYPLQRSVAALFVALAAALAGCQSTSGSWYSLSDKTTKNPGTSLGLVAPLRSLGSAVSGKVRVVDRGDGVELEIAAINILQGNYRVAFHQNGNCSSPNGFSAGPAWAPPGATPSTLVPPFFQANDGATNTVVRVRGVRTTGENGLAGRSVILYSGDAVTNAQPGVPNNMLACGVFEPAQVLF